MDCLHGWAPRGGQDFLPWGHTRRFRWPAVGSDHEVGHRVSRRGNGNGRRYNASADIDAEKRKPPFEWWSGPRTNSWPPFLRHQQSASSFANETLNRILLHCMSQQVADFVAKVIWKRSPNRILSG